MSHELMDSVESYLEARIQNMRIYIRNPILATKASFGYTPLPVIRIGEISTQEQLAQFSRINNLLEEFSECEKKVLKIGAAIKLIGKRVCKYSKSKFKSDKTVNEVCGIIVHPYRPGWHLAYIFMDDDSCVSTDQVKEYRGN